jgi:hypothetical protein
MAAVLLAPGSTVQVNGNRGWIHYCPAIFSSNGICEHSSAEGSDYASLKDGKGNFDLTLLPRHGDVLALAIEREEIFI